MAQRLTQEEAEIRVKAQCSNMGYTFIEFKYINWKTKVPVQCPIEEHGISHIQYNNFISQGYGCSKCSYINQRRTTLSYDLVLSNVIEKCAERNYTFKPFEYIGAQKTYITMTCENNHTWDVSYHKFINGNRTCSKCAGNMKYTQEEAENMLFEVCEKKNLFYERFTYVNNQTPLTLKCSNPTHREWKSNFKNIMFGTSCPTCNTGGYNPSLPGYFYINEIECNGEIYYKFGISNNIKNRMRDYNSNTLSSTMKHLFYSNDGVLVQEIESDIKKIKSIKRGVLPRKLFQDGFSETIEEKDYMTVLKLVESSSLDRLPVL